MANTRAAQRYARALFLHAREQGVDADVRTDMQGLAELMGSSSDFAAFVEHPAVPTRERVAVLKQLFEGKATPLGARFLQFLAQRRRMALLPDVISSYEDLFLEATGVQRIVIETAFALSDAQTDAIKAQMAARYDRTIQAEVQDAPELLGGFRVHVGDEVHDYSIEGKLKRLKAALSR